MVKHTQSYYICGTAKGITLLYYIPVVTGCLVDLFFSTSFSCGDVTIIRKGLLILTYAQCLQLLSSEASSVFHTYCDMGHLWIWSSLRTCNTHYCCLVFGSRAVTTCINNLGEWRKGFEHPTFCMQAECSEPTEPLRHTNLVGE